VIELDTPVLLWWISGDGPLSEMAARAIGRELAGGQIVISSISAWELAMLVNKKRIVLSMDVREWLSIAGQIEAVRFLPMDNEICIESTALPGDFHKDPADRIIVATARRLAVPLVTADEKIHAYPHVRTLW
jgi:PIN domain nuclease of toxin-antitoxin system